MYLLKRVLYLALLTVLAGCCRMKAQTGMPASASQSGVATPTGRGPGDTNGPFSGASQERLEKGRQTDRQRRLIADTDKLLSLATQLKADMDKTTKDTLSIEVIKKAEEIEKLAKSVKDRMKG